LSKYEEIFDCVIKFYLFIYFYIINIIKIEPKIIFTGDSAGGNLITALLEWIIINELPKPIMLLA